MKRAMVIWLVVTSFLSAHASVSNRLVVHEWGTFTSVAGEDGIAIDWRPLTGPSDLPSFVYTVDDISGRDGLRFRPLGKGESGTVRMETPVLYFYTDRELEVSVQVAFPKGQITEWYPRANLVYGTPGLIDWGRFKVQPNATPRLLTEKGESHYYPARETDAAPVQVCSEAGMEHEKFLFYRGVGTFPLPLSAKLEGETVKLKSLGKDAVGTVILFERKGAQVGYRVLDVGGREVIAQRPELNRSVDEVLGELEQRLVKTGLYPKEAKAMVKTWRDQWFEDGLRAFFVLPTAETEALLPLTVSPKPTELVRVLVGRVE
jgi:hypothetical protein